MTPTYGEVYEYDGSGSIWMFIAPLPGDVMEKWTVLFIGREGFEGAAPKRWSRQIAEGVDVLGLMSPKVGKWRRMA